MNSADDQQLTVVPLMATGGRLPATSSGDGSVVAASQPSRSTAGSSDRPLLTLDGLECSFGGVKAVAGASFDVYPGRITGLIGPNGAGKSTVINVVGCQIKPSAGDIQFRGESLVGRSPEWAARHGIARTFQTARLFGRMTVTENLLLGPLPYFAESLRSALLGKWSWKRAEASRVDQAKQLLERFDMFNHRNEYAANLSGGQKRLVEIMRALMSRPAILLLDEPMAGVAPAMSRRIAKDLLALRDEGLTMLLIEHELPLVDLLCDPVIVMVTGRILAEGTLQELRQNEEVVRAYLAD